MTTRSLRWGVVAAGALIAFYVAVLAGASGWAHLGDQARQDWWLLLPIIAGFATQIALTTELRQRHRTHHLGATTGAGTGASAVGMVACCAHHLADLVPLIGATSAAGFLLDWRVPVMLAGIAVNAVAIAIAAHRLRDVTRHHQGTVACAA